MSKKRQRDNMSATGRVFAGPVANTTKNLKLADQLMVMSSSKLDKLDVSNKLGCKRTDLLLSANYTRRPVSGSQHVFCIDELYFADNTAIRLKATFDPNTYYVPTDYAQFQCDIYDARDHTELSLAMMQVCILDLQDIQKPKVYAPTKSCYHDNDFKGVKSDEYVLRRNIFVVFQATLAEDAKEKWKKDMQAAAKHAKVFIAPSMSEAWVQILVQIKDKNLSPTCTYETQCMEPPIITYAGIAMTDAHYHATHGDTFVTSNLYSLITMLNGPVEAVHGDCMHWVWAVERHYYNARGERKARKYWYDDSADPVQGFTPRPAEMNWRDDLRETRAGCKRFEMIPFKMGLAAPGMANNFGVLDSMNQRKVGIAQSNALAFNSIDITNCGKCIN